MTIGTRPALPLLFVRMLRYRVAAMVWMFMLLGVARHGALDRFTLDYLWASLLLASSYVAATCLNDIADVGVDRINHPGDSGRPLVTGEAGRHNLLQVYVIASVLAVGFAVPLGLAGLSLAGLSLLIGWVYSVGPVRLSYRTYAAPLVLSIAYVLVPYLLGLVAAGERPAASDLGLCAALYLLFLARINLKDFRDREGDRQYNKPTLLLRFGKDRTCLISLVALAAGGITLGANLRPPAAVAVILSLYLVAIGSRLHALWRAGDERSEQVAIGLGARAGNGLLISVLTFLLLADSGAPPANVTIMMGVVAVLFGVDFAVLVRRPEQIVIGYKA